MQSNKSIDWPAHLANQKTSGTSQQVYCKANNLNFNSFSYQVQKQKGDGKRFERSNPKQKIFLPIKFKTDSRESIHDYEMLLPSGVALKMSKGFDLKEVGDLIGLITVL